MVFMDRIVDMWSAKIALAKRSPTKFFEQYNHLPLIIWDGIAKSRKAAETYRRNMEEVCTFCWLFIVQTDNGLSLCCS